MGKWVIFLLVKLFQDCIMKSEKWGKIPMGLFVALEEALMILHKLLACD